MRTPASENLPGCTSRLHVLDLTTPATDQCGLRPCSPIYNLQPRSPLHCGEGPVSISSVRMPTPGTTPAACTEEPNVDNDAGSPPAAIGHRQPERSDSDMTVFFPLPDHFCCTEMECSRAFRSEAWTSQRASLKRHLEQERGIRISSFTYACSTCSASLGKRPTQQMAQHVCSRRQTANSRKRSFAFKCSRCGVSFPSRKGRDNHESMHRRREARERLTTDRRPSGHATWPPCDNAATTEPCRTPGDSSCLEPFSHSEHDSLPHSESRRPRLPNDEPIARDAAACASQGSLPSTCTISKAPSDEAARNTPSDATMHSHTPNLDNMSEQSPSNTDPEAFREHRSENHHHELPAECASAEATEEMPVPDNAEERPTMDNTSTANSTIHINNQPELEQDAGYRASLTSTAGEEGTQTQEENVPRTSGVEEPLIRSNDMYVLAEHLNALRGINHDPVNDTTWKRFEDILENTTKAVSEFVRLPAPRSGTYRPINVGNPKDIQACYRRNRRQAVRLIANGPPSPCDVGMTETTRHFQTVWDHREHDSPGIERPKAPEEVNLSPFTSEEVESRLKKCENTAPGDDRLTYRHWRSADPHCRFLAATFNLCLKYRRVPTCWKTSRTILIHKKGDRADLTNWRPISLGSTLGKLYTGCLASRLRAWILENDVLSQCQKGFLPYDGVLEHNFILQERLDQARTRKELCLAFLDFANVFGSVPHGCLIDGTSAAGAGNTFSKIVKDLYTNNEASVICSEGTTPLIPVNAGIRQGCPLSGLLFNLVIDPLVRQVQGQGSEHRILAYADDITPMAASPEELQDHLDLISRLAWKIGLSLNPTKCRTMHLSGVQPVGLRPTQFFIEGMPVQPIREYESFKYLGRSVGFNPLPDNSTIDDAVELGRKILTSVLAPWQRMYAVKTFLFPGLNFAMRMGSNSKSDWKRLDSALRPLIR
ncbi:uncharacterized protein LOC135372827 [Ornithodoros turicata]|uniref:uncharacterized protein LOC135372827 n=1 Tax=Ornithodoros turicata TaxID=34597 RepID=UPI00313A2E9C